MTSGHPMSMNNLKVKIFGKIYNNCRYNSNYPGFDTYYIPQKVQLEIRAFRLKPDKQADDGSSYIFYCTYCFFIRCIKPVLFF